MEGVQGAERGGAGKGSQVLLVSWPGALANATASAAANHIMLQLCRYSSAAAASAYERMLRSLTWQTTSLCSCRDVMHYPTLCSCRDVMNYPVLALAVRRVADLLGDA